MSETEKPQEMTIKDAFTKHLDMVREEADKVCSEYIKTPKISALLLAEAQRTPRLYDCMQTVRGRTSILNFYMLAAQLGLEPGAAMQMLYPIPKEIKKEWCILPVVGYKGYCELAHRSGKIKRITANVFYEGEIESGSLVISKEPPDIRHTYDPSIDESDDKVKGVYAMVEMVDGGRYLLVMNKDKIIARAKRGGSYGSDYSPWKTDFQAMARKTVIRALLSGGLVPISTEIRTALAQDSDSIHDSDDQSAPSNYSRPRPQPVSGEEAVKSALRGGGGGIVDADFESVPEPDDNPFDPASL